jgi:hypothetical protein
VRVGQCEKLTTGEPKEGPMLADAAKTVRGEFDQLGAGLEGSGRLTSHGLRSTSFVAEKIGDGTRNIAQCHLV